MTNERESVVLATTTVVVGTAVAVALEWRSADGIRLVEAISGMAGLLVVVVMLVIMFKKSQDSR